MALDVASLTLDDSQASLASMPEELWRKIGGYLTPATTARAFVVAGGRSSSLQNALRAEIEQTERAMFGMTRRDAEHVLVAGLVSADSSLLFASDKLAYLLHSSCSSSELLPLRWGRRDLTIYHLTAALLAYGADPNAMYNGVPALVLVARLVASRRPTIDPIALAGLLLRAGANPIQTDSDGMSALATCYQNLQTWYERRDREEAVTKLAVIKELILYLVVATHKHMRLPGTGQAGLDGVYDLFKTQEAALGTTYFDVLARYLRSLDNWARDERFLRVQVNAGGDTEEIMERVKNFASSIMSLHISTRTFLCRRGEPPPDAAADEPEGGLEAYARHFM